MLKIKFGRIVPMMSLRFDKFISALTAMSVLRNQETKMIHYDVTYNDEYNLVRLTVSDVKSNRVGKVIMSQDEFNKNLETWSEKEIAERLLSIAFDKLLGQEQKWRGPK